MVASSGFSVCSIIVTVLLLLLFFLPLNSFYLFFWFFFLIVVARTSKNMLNKSGNNEHFCLIHVVKGIAFSFSLLSMMMLAVCLTYAVLIMLR